MMVFMMDGWILYLRLTNQLIPLPSNMVVLLTFLGSIQAPPCVRSS